MVPHEEKPWVAGGRRGRGMGFYLFVYIILCHLTFVPRVYILWLLKYRVVLKIK